MAAVTTHESSTSAPAAAALNGVAQADRRIAEVLELVGLTERARDVVRRFSGGMQRWVAIGRALLHDPALLILDEPTVGVDVETRHQIWAHIRSLKTEGRTVRLTTNYLDEAEALCDRVAILRAGTLVAEDTLAALTARTGRCLALECWAEHAPWTSASGCTSESKRTWKTSWAPPGGCVRWKGFARDRPTSSRCSVP